MAEIGHNHQGSLEKARELFREAKAAGAHAVKLQKRDNRGLYTRAAYNKPYDNENSFGSPFDSASANFLHDLDVPAYKIASGDLKSTPLLKHVAPFGKPIIISTGGATIEDVQSAYEWIIPST